VCGLRTTRPFLEEQVGKDGCPKDIKSYCTDIAVRFILRFGNAADADAALLSMELHTAG
jgi:hypothetical protein